MSSCCQGSSCDCYEEGYDDGERNAENDIDGYNLLLEKSALTLNEVKVWPRDGGFVARVSILFPEGNGKTEKEAIGDLVFNLIAAGYTICAMRRF